jgi:hypothetical protein
METSASIDCFCLPLEVSLFTTVILISSGYYNHGIESDVIYSYANHSITQIGSFYNDEDASEAPGTYEVNGEIVTPDAYNIAIQENNSKN